MVMTAEDRRAADPLWAGPRQPARRPFRIQSAAAEPTPVRQVDLWERPFAALTRFVPEPARAVPKVLVAPPLSGHFPLLAHDLVVALLADFDVHVVDWVNARYVPTALGAFPMDEAIAYLRDMIAAVGPDGHVIALCQAALPAFAATALAAQADPSSVPRSLTLIAAPIDPLANPTRLAHAVRAHSPAWFERRTLSVVEADFPGAGRSVYPAWRQLAALMSYLSRHMLSRDDLSAKILHDDGVDPRGHPFIDAYSSIMDLDGRCFLDTIRLAFHERALARGVLEWRGAPVDFGAIERTALMTIEGAFDDVAAPGQTAAAHALCPHVPAARRAQLVADEAGHFSTFHGALFRTRIAPRLREFILNA